jgi:hypothetical protein
VDGIYQTTIPGNDANPQSWDTGIDLTNNGSVTYSVKATWGVVGSESIVMDMTYDCEFGVLNEGP